MCQFENRKYFIFCYNHGHRSVIAKTIILQIIFFKQTLKRPTLRPSINTIILCNTIHIIFPINKTQWLIVKGVLHCVILTTMSNYVQKESQLLSYIWGEGVVGKSRVVNAIELGFSLLSYRADLILVVPTRAAASNIERSTIHTWLGIGIRNN